MNIKFIKTCFLSTLLAFMLSGCGTNSGEENKINPDSNGGGTSTNTNYTGPAPITTDIQNFKLNVWDNLVSTDRCGACHSTGGQSPTFVDDSNINTAYAQANTIINLQDPSQSAMVAKVAGGHNCWLTSATACADIITRFIQNWAGGSAGSTTEIVLRSPAIKDTGSSKPFPEDSVDFSSTVYPLLTSYCSECHTEGNQTPFIASADVDTSYEAVKSKIDLTVPTNSRIYLRLKNEFHNCWDNNCTTSSAEMETAISNFSDLVETEEVDQSLVISKALKLIEDGLAANAGGRFEDNIIALFEFKEGEGNSISNDTSGVEPAMNLSLSGNVEWVGGWGIKVGPANDEHVKNGKAQASTTTSSKLHELITASGEYSLEAWIVPGNVTQEDARIITYSGASDARNFTLGQTLYNYDFLQRSTTTDQNEALTTDDDAERLQASLQHVVVTFSPGEARKIYVNGVYTGDVDPNQGGLLTEWDNSYAFVLGNETDTNSLWQGTLRMVAIHNRAMTEEQILQNYNVGVGEKFLLLFSVSHLVNVPDSFIVFEVSQFDSFSYLFTEPFFISLDETASFDNIPLKGMKLGINGKESTSGQTFSNIDLNLDDSLYTVGTGQNLSSMGTIIALEQGPDVDEFFLSFEQLGNCGEACENVVVQAPPAPTPEPADLEPAAEIGLKTFDEINASMAQLTGINRTNANVKATFETVKQQLPTVENITGFLSAHQMAITQMAIQYCDALVEDTSLSASFFPGFDFNTNANTAFDTAGRNLIITPLLAKLVGSNLSSQPSDASISTELNSLIDTLTACSSDNSCTSERSKTVVKATCAAVLGSAVTLVQ